MAKSLESLGKAKGLPLIFAIQPIKVLNDSDHIENNKPY